MIDGKVHRGPHRIAGEWGHNPLPWPTRAGGARSALLVRAMGLPGNASSAGPALARDCDGPDAHDASSLPARAAAGEQARARDALARHADRLARGLAVVVNMLDPDVIVLGGGLSNMEHLYTELPGLIAAARVQRCRANARRPQQARRFVGGARGGVAMAGGVGFG